MTTVKDKTLDTQVDVAWEKTCRTFGPFQLQQEQL